MKLTILVPSPPYLVSAGTRIRYQRLREPFARAGHVLNIATIDSIDAGARLSKQDMFLFSKVQDARGVALAHALRSKGARVGVDLFDDYFSQTGDPRFAPQRLWLKEMAGTADFFLCSTARMKRVVEHHFAGARGHVLGDPFERFERERLGPLLNAKRQAALAARRIDVLWFGMGDNPNFPVGLHDLAHYGYLLDDFRRDGFEVRLRVLTNARALDAPGLALLRRLPIKAELEEWTQMRETALLEESLVAFLPVNAQGFSIAKSLNRAVTALTSGTQVLTAGYPLYAVLDEFLYHDARALLDDLVSGGLRVSSATLDGLGAQLDLISNPLLEAKALCTFLDAVPAPPAADGQVPLAILHGERSTSAIHKFARQREWLSLGSPFTPLGPAYDAHLAVFEVGAPASLRLTDRAANLLVPHLSAYVRPVAGARDGLSLEIGLGALDAGMGMLLNSTATARSSGARMALYPHVAGRTRSLYQQAFGSLRFIDSELNPLLCQVRELENHAIRVPS